MEELLNPKSEKAQRAPAYIRTRAIKDGKQVLYINDGFVQWSVRPFEQGYGCDGTTDPNIHLIGRHLCAKLGLDYKALYTKAYKKHDGSHFDASWLDDLSRYEQETILPDKVSDRTLKLLLYDLGEINNSSMVNLLTDTFTELNYDVDEWWMVKDKAA